MSKKWIRVLTFVSWLAALRLLIMVGIALFAAERLETMGVPPEVIEQGRWEILWDVPTAALLIFWPLFLYRR